MNEEPVVNFRYYGISPWEIEVLYSYFNSKFRIIQDEIESFDEKYVSFLELSIPFEFNEKFFQWFEFRRWEKIKALLKEMKRRRGSGNVLKLQIVFHGNPDVNFVLDVEDKTWYDNAVEKMDFVLELLPYHLDPTKLPKEVNSIIYQFDPKSVRWRLGMAVAENKNYVHRGDNWVPT